MFDFLHTSPHRHTVALRLTTLRPLQLLGARSGSETARKDDVLAGIKCHANATTDTPSLSEAQQLLMLLRVDMMFTTAIQNWYCKGT